MGGRSRESSPGCTSALRSMNGSARFSPEPNPRWVAYTSDESGRYEIYVQSFPEPKRKWQISMGGGMLPQWGAGGQELFYVAPNGKLMSVKLKVGADSVEPSAPRELFSVCWRAATRWRPMASDSWCSRQGRAVRRCCKSY